jgi:hypothetical protein
MIQKQFYKKREDGVNLYITFSDEGMMIEKKSNSKRKELYRTAVDVESAKFEYVETLEPINFNKKERLMLEQLGRKYLLPNDTLDLE